MLSRLPNGYTARSIRLSDVEALARMFNEDSRRLYGVDQHAAANLETEWRTPGFDLERDTRAIFAPSGEPAGYAEVWDIDPPHVRLWSWGCVRPKERGRGIGSALVAWQDERGRAAVANAPVGTRVSLRQTVSCLDEPAGRLLESNGYDAIRRNYQMRIELDAPTPSPAWPGGVTVRTFDPARDLEPMVDAVRAAFRDHWGYVESPLESDLAVWRHIITEEKDFDASLWFLAVRDGDIVAMALCSAKEPEDPDLGYVNTLGVVREWRRQGIGLALLHHAFAELGRRGKKRVGLGVDGSSLTGAVRLYERAGMHVERERRLYEKELRPGTDLTTQHLED
ncbi:MAG: GNAT family N-acetyltransferase [Candidatus Bipolaricaulota bacterium]|nr:GNAT family N-acetyltransferase [Candidatus Bipolaricaulota bacterium]